MRERGEESVCGMYMCMVWCVVGVLCVWCGMCGVWCMCAET